MSFYDWLTERSWRAGQFVVQGAAKLQGKRAWENPAVLRERLKSAMERIAIEEAEIPFSSREAGMKLAKFVKFREEKFGAVLFETRSEKVYTLNPTGAAVVREIVASATDTDSSGRANGDVIERLKAKFDDKSGSMEAEAREFIACLKDKGLITE